MSKNSSVIEPILLPSEGTISLRDQFTFITKKADANASENIAEKIDDTTPVLSSSPRIVVQKTPPPKAAKSTFQAVESWIGTITDVAEETFTARQIAAFGSESAPGDACLPNRAASWHARIALCAVPVVESRSHPQSHAGRLGWSRISCPWFPVPARSLGGSLCD